MKKLFLFLTLAIAIILPAKAQDIKSLVRDVVLKVDTNEFTLTNDRIMFQGDPFLAFSFSNPEPVCEVTLVAGYQQSFEELSLLPSGDFEIIDSLLQTDGETMRFKVRFNDLINVNYLKFSFIHVDNMRGDSGLLELNLLPYTDTYLKFYPPNDELYIGEEKVFELLSNNIDNIQFENDWVIGENMNYRISKTFNQIRLHVVPKTLGRQKISIPIRVKKPIMDAGMQVDFDLPLIEYTFFVKQSRLQFLNVDQNEVTLDDSTRLEGIEIQMDNSRLLQLQKTYRLESQEEPGGNLIAELFTKNSLTNNRVLCVLRVYNYHRKSDGYLYIKDGDSPKFITNIDITPKTTVERISILRNGFWSENTSVYPGEIINVKIEGEGLHKAEFKFEQMEDITAFDSIIRGENLALYMFKVPMDIAVRRLELFSRADPMDIFLTVKEYQEPRPFDFLWINHQGVRHSLADLPATVMIDGTIQNLIFGADPNMIDSNEKLYGKQYLRLDITITGRRNELIEVKTIENIVVCPGIRSPRTEHYNLSDCILPRFDMNNYFREKTSNLEIWSTIKMRVSHQSSKYSSPGTIQEFDMILRKPSSFDIEVSFPAGLITDQKPDADNPDQRLGQLSGISIAMIGQFTFYHPEKINVQRPYKIGAGILALNTFNFSDDADNRDIGLVILGSLYPTTKDVKLTFPLYFGGGYQLKNQKWFLLIGPGIKIRL